MPDQSLNSHSSGTGNDPGKDADRCTVTCYFHQPIGDHFKILTAPLWSLSIHLGHSVFAETSIARREAPRGQQPMQVRADTDSMCLVFI